MKGLHWIWDQFGEYYHVNETKSFNPWTWHVFSLTSLILYFLLFLSLMFYSIQCTNLVLLFFLYWFERGKRERGREREIGRERFVAPLIYASTCCFLYAPWLGIKTATLAYGADALNNWTSEPGLALLLLNLFLRILFFLMLFKIKLFFKFYFPIVHCYSIEIQMFFVYCILQICWTYFLV